MKAIRFSIAAFCVLACRPRYEFVQPDCPDISDPPGQSAIGWQAAGAGRQIIGVVVAIETGQPVAGAQVRIGSTAQWTATDSLGRINLVHAPGPESLHVRFLNHQPVHVLVPIKADTGVRFVASLRALPLRMTDGCGFVLERRQKPWWKLW